MKKRLKIFLSLFLVMIFCIIPVQVSAGDVNGIKIEVPYQYPIHPDTEEWAQFDKRDQKVEACQIPDQLLTNMSTKALAITVLNYPLLNDYIAYNDHLLAAQNLEKEFNGYRELLTRRDINDVLLEIYQENKVYSKNTNYQVNNKSDTSEELYKFFLISNIEFLISYSQVYGNSLSDEQQEVFLSELVSKNEARFNTNLFSKVSYEYINFWESISNKDDIAEMDIVLPIQTLAGENGTYKNILTPNGSSVQAIYNRSPELTSTEKNNYNSYMESRYPNATRISEPTVKYNCHSYAWYIKSSSNQYWINQKNSSGGANLSKYWTDGSYHEVSSGTSVGTRVFYYNGDHSAVFQTRKIVAGSPTWIYRSKWGACGLYDHYLYDCPYPSGMRYYARS